MGAKGKKQRESTWLSSGVSEKMLDGMCLAICPVTGGRPTTMTRKGWERACAEKLAEADLERGNGKKGYQLRALAWCRKCRGKKKPRELKIMSLKKMQKEVKMSRDGKGTCEVCGEKGKDLRNNHGKKACYGCQNMQARIKKHPESVVAEMQRLVGDAYFPAREVEDSHQNKWAMDQVRSVLAALGKDEDVEFDDLGALVRAGLENSEAPARKIINQVRDLLEIDEDAMAEEIPEIVAGLQLQIQTLETANADLAAQVMELEQSVDEYADRENKHTETVTALDQTIRELQYKLKHGQAGAVLEAKTGNPEVIEITRLLADDKLRQAVNTLAESIREAA